MNIDNDDEELEDIDAPSLYNMKKDIKIDHDNMGFKSYSDNCRKVKRMKQDEEQKLNPMAGMYPCIKR